MLLLRVAGILLLLLRLLLSSGSGVNLPCRGNGSACRLLLLLLLLLCAGASGPLRPLPAPSEVAEVPQAVQAREVLAKEVGEVLHRGDEGGGRYGREVILLAALAP